MLHRGWVVVVLVGCQASAEPAPFAHVIPAPPPAAPMPREARDSSKRHLLEKGRCPKGSIQLSWMLVLPNGTPFPDEPFRVLFEDGTVGDGRTRADGTFHFCHVPAGDHCAEVAGYVTWIPATRNDGDPVGAWALFDSFRGFSEDEEELRSRCNSLVPGHE